MDGRSIIPPDSTTGRIRMKTAIFVALILAVVAAHPHSRLADSPQKVADRILIVKSTRTMTLMRGVEVLKTYKVALGSQPVGPKEREGDGKTPEGDYIVDSRNAQSRFHLALHVSYPNARDRDRARKLKVNPGGQIMIHGLPKGFGWVGPSHRMRDWTQGCIAVTNGEIEEIWRLVPTGTPVAIHP